MKESNNVTDRAASKGIAIETIGYLILAVIALIVLWIFLSKMMPIVTDTVNNIIHGLVCQICNIFGWLKNIIAVVGICSGC